MADIDPLKVLFFVVILGAPIWLLWRILVEVVVTRDLEEKRWSFIAKEPEFAPHQIAEDLVHEALREELRPHIGHLVAGTPDIEAVARTEIHNAMYRARRTMEIVHRM